MEYPPRLTGGSYLYLVLIVTFAITKSRTQQDIFFDPAPFGTNVAEGDETILRCDVSNRKHIIFYWTLDDRRVANTSRRYQVDSDLRILRVTKEEDSGSFRCIATNTTTGVSIRSIEAKLNIFWMTSVAEVQMRHPRLESHIAEGNYVNLRCHAEGNPDPEVKWFKNQMPVPSTSERVRAHKNRLKISNITADDNGIYSCRARNPSGVVDSSQSFLLNVPSTNAAHLNQNTFTQTRLVKQGDTAQFDCQYENAILTEWYFGNQRLTNSSTHKSTVFSNGTLQLHEVQPNDIGAYKCVGISENGPAQTFAATLILAYVNNITAESFDPRPSDDMPMVVPLNQKFEIKCFKPDGLPPPSLRWEDPAGAEVPIDGRIKAVDDRLYVSNAQETDTGNYSCVAQNLAGRKAGNVWLVVSVPPVIIRAPHSTREMEGTEAQFECQTQRTPYPVSRILWTKDSVPIDDEHPRFNMNQQTGVLTIRDVHLTDEGNYACVVQTANQNPVESTNAHLYVTKRLKFRPPPVNAKLELHTNSRIHCIAEGETEPHVTWRKEGVDALPDHIQDVDGVLYFTGVQFADEGNYTCHAQSSQGDIEETIAVLVVIKPRFQVRPMNTTAYEGYPIMLHCVAVGDPNPTIQWDKNLKVNSFDFNRFKILQNGSLQVSEVYMEDMGKYGCTAGNSGGFQREEIYLQVASAEKYAHDRQYKEASFSMLKTIIIAVCSAVAYLAVVIGLTVYCSIRLVKAKNLRKTLENNAAPMATEKGENGHLPNENTELMNKTDRDSSIVKSDDARSHVSGVSSHPSQSQSSNSHQSGRRRSYDKLIFPRHDLQTLGMLGKGHFGDVFLAKAHGIKDGEPETLVVVKSLLSRDEQHQFQFRREIDMFCKVHHENVARLLGVCREMEPQFSIAEYCEWGDLKQFLWATRKDNMQRPAKLPPLTLVQKISMCNQVALGMEHIANLRFVHRDLAARNILLTPALHLKVANLSLCRDVYAAEYYPFHQQLIPLRWTSPESLLDDDYSTKSDVWSYGVFCWEVFMLGDMPYKKRTDEDVIKSLKMGDLLLDSPPNCPKEIHEIIEKCTADRPQDRPSFSEIAVLLSELHIDTCSEI